MVEKKSKILKDIQSIIENLDNYEDISKAFQDLDQKRDQILNNNTDEIPSSLN